jgi:hypothetical protein
MRAISRLVLVAALLIGLAPATASAQRWTADFGVNGGYSWYSQMISDEWQVGTGPSADVREGARFRAGPLLGAQLTFWPAANIGIRANMTYAERPVITDGPFTGSDILQGNINLWSGSGDLMFRLRGPSESWIGRETLPYIALGLGAKWVNPSGDHWTCGPAGGDSFECAPLVVGPNPRVALGERSVMMGLIGLGADFRMSPRIALRAELNDRIYKPPVYGIAAGTVVGPTGNIALVSDSRASKWVHEIGAQLGLHFLMGLRYPPPVAVAPLPPAPPPPPPPPPAAPREDAITVCVIDPTATGGIRMQTATFRHATNDTIVMVGGQAQPLRQVVGTGVMTARDAGWYVRGEPLALTINRETVRFLPYQTATRIEPTRIVYLGNVQGYPVYADRDEVADVITALQTARGTRTDVELGTLLAGTDARTRDVVQRAAFLYVPMDPYGCVFQPIQRQEDVRKGK